MEPSSRSRTAKTRCGSRWSRPIPGSGFTYSDHRCTVGRPVSVMVERQDRSARTSCRDALSHAHRGDDNQTLSPDRLVVDADSLCELPLLIRYTTDLTPVPHNHTGHMLA